MFGNKDIQNKELLLDNQAGIPVGQRVESDRRQKPGGRNDSDQEFLPVPRQAVKRSGTIRRIGGHLLERQTSKLQLKHSPVLLADLKEPEHWSDYVISVISNMLEEVLFLAVLTICGITPSYVSLLGFIMTLPVLFQKALSKEESLQFSQSYSKYALIPLGLIALIKVFFGTVYLGSGTPQNLVSLNSWGFVFDQDVEGQMELNLIKSLDVEIIECIMFSLIYVVSSLFLEDMKKSNNIMIVCKSFAYLGHLFAAIFFLVTLTECVTVQNAINFFILILMLVNLVSQSIRGGKQNENFNYTVVAIVMSLLAFQFFEHILLHISSVQVFASQNPYALTDLIVIFASLAYLPSKSQDEALSSYSLIDRHILLLTSGLLMGSLWRSARQMRKDIDVRELHFAPINVRDNNVSTNQDLESSTASFSRSKRLKKLGVGLLQKEKEKYVAGLSWMEIRNEFFSLKPWTLICLASIGEIIIAYSYNNKQGLIHLTWALLSCILPLEVHIHISLWIMGPFLFLMFFFMYTMPMRLILFGTSSQLLVNEMSFQLAYPGFELAYLYFMVILFALMYRSKKYVSSKNLILRRGLFKRVKLEGQSIFWCYLFMLFRYLHVLVLLMLFLIGIGEITFFNLGLMFFFIIYAMSQDFYRKAGFLLLIFISVFIWGQYLWTLIYKRFTSADEQISQTYQILKLINWVHDVSQNQGLVFDYNPPLQYWTILFLMIILCLVNGWFQDKQEVAKAEEACDEKMSKRYPKSSKILKRAAYIIKEGIIFVFVFTMALVIARQSPNMINFLFMCICFIFLGYILAGDESTYRMCITLCKILKGLSGIVLILNASYLIVTNSKVLDNVTFDEEIWAKLPHVAINIDIIGFSSNRNDLSSNRDLWWQLAGYLFFLFVGNVLHSLYQSQIDSLENEDKINMKEVFEEEDKLENYHEKHRFTVPYMVYKMTHHWITFDYIAMYFHIPVNLIILGFAIYYEVSLFMALNIICIVIFYVHSAVKLHRQTSKTSFLEEKIGLDKAYNTSKAFKLAASDSFMSTRRGLWYFQYFLLIVSLAFIYPSPIFDKLMNRYPDHKENYETFLFYFFWAGFYKGSEARTNFAHIVPQFTLIIMLIFEKIAQKWLLTRFGCSLQKIAYFREAELRLQIFKNKAKKEQQKNSLIDIKAFSSVKKEESLTIDLKASVSAKKEEEEEMPAYTETPLPKSTTNFATQGEARQVVNTVKDKFNKANDESRLQKIKEMIEASIQRQTRVNKAKGHRVMLEQLCLLCLLLSCSFKSNIISCFNMLCILMYILAPSKTQVMPFIIAIIGTCFMVQYTIYLLNLYELNAPQHFPQMFQPYPNPNSNPYGHFLFPLFAKFEYLREVDHAYFFAMGLQQQTLRSLWLDLINLFMMTVYFLEYKNPILRRSVQVSWSQTEELLHQGQVMKKDEALTEYKRLLFLKNPQEDKVTEKERFEQLRETVSSYSFIKGACNMIYLSSHVFTLTTVLMLAILSRSLISLGYLAIVLPYILTSLSFFRVYGEYEKKKWSFVYALNYGLIIYSFLDFVVQVTFQFPYFKPFTGDITIGLMKIWNFRDGTLSYNDLINKKDNISLVVINIEAVIVLFSKCAIIYICNLQKEIFISKGFQNFVEKQEKGVKRLVDIAEDKALCITYNYNNQKLKQIVTMQKKKKQNLETVQELKQKIRLWRERHYDQVAQQVFPISNRNVEDTGSLKGSLIEVTGNIVKSSFTSTRKEHDTLPQMKGRQATILRSIHKAKKRAEMYKELRKIKRELPLCAQFFQCLSKRFTNKILFIERKSEIDRIKSQLQNGEIAIFSPVEEKILMDIKIWMRAKENEHAESSLFQNNEAHKTSDLKLENMNNTKEFIKTWHLTKLIFQNIGQIIASNTHNLAYLFMIISMYYNASLLAIGYPILVFGFALLEETRPGQRFWKTILYYTLTILMLKFTYQFFNTKDTTLELIQNELKLGLQAYKDSTYTLFKYILPETFILYFVLAHMIHTELLGFTERSESQIESIKDAIKRNLDPENKMVKKESKSEELKRIFKEERDRVLEEQDGEDEAEKILTKGLESNRNELMYDIQQNFFFDAKRNKHRTKIDNSFCFDREKLKKEVERIKENKRKKLGFFERWQYFQRLFPIIKAQKPGWDLYMFNSIILFTIFFYIMIYYDDMVASGIFTGQKSALRFSLVLLLIFHIGLLVTERMISRTDTKVSQIKRKVKNQLRRFTLQMMEKKQFNSMSMHLKTIRKNEQSIRDKDAQEALQEFGEAEQVQEDESESIEIDKTRITIQQKTKFIIHWMMLILVHIAVFWYYPIYGNIELYGEPDCNNDLAKFPYGCKNFSSNGILQTVYILYLLYFLVSALQIKYGLPQFRTVTTTAQYNDFSYVCHLVYSGAPWIMELKVMIDFMFTKTAMDIFQWWQFNRYHSEFYIAKMGNRNYYIKKLGIPIQGLEKFIFGFCFLFASMFLIISPLVLFSDIGATSAPNIVRQSTIEVNLIIKNITEGSDAAPLTYNVYKTQNPYISSFDDMKFSQYNFTQQPETKFFTPDQIQSVKPSIYSDLKWGISQENLVVLTSFLDKQYHNDSTFNVIVQLKYKFSRDGPSDSKEAIGTQEMVLNINDPVDANTISQLIGMKEVNCGQDYDFSQVEQAKTQQDITLKKFYFKSIQLGSTADVKTIQYVNEEADSQLHDMKLRYMCVDQWVMLGEDDQEVEFVVFNEHITAGFLEGYDLTTFYVGVVLACGTLFRANALFITPLAFIYEISDPDSILTLCDYIMQMRHEQNTTKEEECYMMLVEIIRSPELCKALTGSSLKGELGPQRDAEET